MQLIPRDAIAQAGMLVIFHILEDGRLNSDVEVIALVGTYRDKAGAHLEAMHLSRDGAIHIGNLVGVEIRTCRCCYRPVLGGTDAGVHAQVLGPLAIVFQLFIIK